jgi:NTE family protein
VGSASATKAGAIVQAGTDGSATASDAGKAAADRKARWGRKGRKAGKSAGATAEAGTTGPDEPDGPGPIAFVMSSGRNLGAVQIGMLRALVEHGVVPDLVVGCSVGAVNGAAFAEDPSLARIARLEHVWLNTEAKDLMPRPWKLPPAVSLARRIEAIHTFAGLRALIEQTLDAATFEELAVPFHCLATDVADASEAWFDQGPLVEKLLASAAIPAMFPSVEVDGRRFVDGAVVNDVPIGRAVDLGARTIYVLEVGSFWHPWTEPKRPAEAAIQAYNLARQNRFRRELDSVPEGIDVHVLPHGEPPHLRLRDMSQSPLLLAAAHKASATYLDDTLG